jgi:chromate reductase, NAD(P)H dehydrogenase (quinone)
VTIVLALSGSLQTRSSNTALVRLASRLAEAPVEVDIFDALEDLPYFNPELDVEPAPRAVADLRARVAAAEAVLIASPEYAHEMPGVLKNALDWLVSSGELYGKRVAVLCASPSSERGAYVRQALERTLGAEGATVVVSATVAVAPAHRSEEPAGDVVRAVRSALGALLA